MNTKRKYGWLPDVPDHRDFRYSAIMPTYKTLPPSVDLRNFCSPVEDQGALGSCTANALVGNLEFLQAKSGVAGGMGWPFKGWTDLSRLFLYYNERVFEGNTSSDSGAFLRDGIKVLHNLGVCPEAAWPYDLAKFTEAPPPDCYTLAENFKISVYRRMDSLQAMRTCLAEGFPFVFGFSVYESFESEEVARTGIVQLPSASEHLLGGHAVMAVGYDNGNGTFTVRNSWGPVWGQGGYFTIPYEYLVDRNLSDDFWTVRA